MTVLIIDNVISITLSEILLLIFVSKLSLMV